MCQAPALGHGRVAADGDLPVNGAVVAGIDGAVG
jgi:hypothetical protein